MIMVRFLALIVACCLTALAAGFGYLFEVQSIFVTSVLPVALAFVFAGTYLALVPVIRHWATRA